ncbi:hypothetical protein BBF96_11210 [Anoxybacter fermentans]|uniref:Uncharacterized protein n=1 Tax=Anoxybacter fermentans TaxID=1323375 RepID=A0A3S9T017_9FIRM|nr:hypothetical protein BBF96_11210 [Anoxybacter fermentans]
MIRKSYFDGNRALDGSKNFSRSEKLAFCSLIIFIISKSIEAWKENKEKLPNLIIRTIERGPYKV